jgi:hypothetical protein
VEVEVFVHIVRNVVFYDLENLGHLVSQTKFCRTPKQLCKTHKTGTTLGEQANGMYNPNYILLLNTVVVIEN